jgi:hypothetical protein
MNRSQRIRLERLALLEAEFRELLIPCLEQCIHGRWGLFRTFDYLGQDRKYWNWPEADHLREIALSIQEILEKSGEANELCSDFLRLCTIHTANDPGEPKLARALLDRTVVLQGERKD